MKKLILPILLLITLTVFAQDTNVNIRKIGGTVIGDPCQTTAATTLPLNQAVTGPITIVTGVASKKIYICSIFLTSATEQNVNMIEGTGANCSIPIVGLFGGTTANTGPALAAKSGWTYGNGDRRVAMTKTAATNLCLVSSGGGRITGSISYVQR